MRARMVAGLASAALSVTASAAVAVTVNDDDPSSRVGSTRAMMSPQWQDLDPSGTGWQQRGWMTDTPGMMQGAHVRSEYDYLVTMVAHHAEAVAAATELQRSDRPQTRAFGKSIAASQTAQIEQMRDWLPDWYPDRSRSTVYHPMMRDLSGLSGDPLDRAFLQDMTVHHIAAVMMSQQLLMHGLADHPQAAALARAIRSEQRAEIVQMQRWLREWFGRGGHHWYGWDQHNNDPWDDDSDHYYGGMMGGPGMMGYREAR